MNNDEYEKIINKIVPKEKITKNVLISFLSGGVIGVIAQFLVNLFNKIYTLNDSYLLTFIIFILVGSILTGFGIFDKILSLCKCGLIVPTTGFANTMTSSAMDCKSEGFIKGIGSSIFKLTGSIILYGVVFGIIFGFIRSIL